MALSENRRRTASACLGGVPIALLRRRRRNRRVGSFARLFADSWQWRHVVGPRAASYRVIASDYRGAGNSSRPRSDPGYPADPRGDVARPAVATRSRKWQKHSPVAPRAPWAQPTLRSSSADIGWMVTTAYASRSRDDTRALITARHHSPGTSYFGRMKNAATDWHFFLPRHPRPARTAGGRPRTPLSAVLLRPARRPTHRRGHRHLRKRLRQAGSDAGGASTSTVPSSRTPRDVRLA